MIQIIGKTPVEILAAAGLYYRWSKQLYLYLAILFPEVPAARAKPRRGSYRGQAALRRALPKSPSLKSSAQPLASQPQILGFENPS